MTITDAIPALAWPWIWAIPAAAIGWLAGWVQGDDHGRNQTNREWLTPQRPRYFVKLDEKEAQ